MNEKNLHALINRYEEDYYDVVNNRDNNEIFKWQAVQQFQKVWFADESRSLPFHEMFREAQKKTSILINNAFVSPTNGIIKLAEKEPETVEKLFREVLFAEDGGDISLRQDHMDKFLEEIEKLRIKHFPRFYKYKQERHAASCYLAMYAPEDNYIYRYSDAELFARYIEFGKDIGQGQTFRLEHYYEMCDIIVDALRQHTSLIEKYNKFLNEQCYPDQSLHLMAFDLIYCTKTYQFYIGLPLISKKESLQKFTQEQLRKQEQLEKEKIYQALLEERECLEQGLAPYLEVSLVGVEITSAQYGIGVVIKHDEKKHNMVQVRFESCEKTYRLHKEIWPMMRPTFEDDQEIISIMTEYEQQWKKLENVRKRIENFA